MSVAQQALALARIEAGEGSADDKARLKAWDRLYSLLGTLDSKTSVLLRFNAIVVAALAYVTVVRSADPFAGVNPTVALIGVWVGHVSLVLSVASCGFAFPVINVEWQFLERSHCRGGWLRHYLRRCGPQSRRHAGGAPHLALCLGMAARRRRRRGLCPSGRAGDHPLRQEHSWPT